MHTFTNHLIHESSPYLLQHAHNPVEWFPWGDAALQKARQENKPILVSIGYSACHWCHVMERESFEDEATAAIMNEHFVNIKIDREERPDIDHIYMDAVQAMTGSGGWPLNVFLLPDGRPFYGGTYFPPVNAYGRRSWTEVLMLVKNAYTNKPDELQQQAEQLTAHLNAANAFGHKGGAGDALFSEAALESIASNLLKNADTAWGGFGKAPKFPQTFSIQFLLRYAHQSGNAAALQQALLSLDKMMDGGIYDHLGGGFARYSTDEQWLAPHFEKMLYDNALLISVLSEAYQLTGNERYKDVIVQTLDFVQREMMDEAGGFYSALDADSEGVEGKFYTWSMEEINLLLGEDAPAFCACYDVSSNGNWDHTNILWRPQPLSIIAAQTGLSEEALNDLTARCRQKLLGARSGRIRPGLDDKILLSWNALMCVALCKAFAATGMEQYRSMAVQNMLFLQSAFRDAQTNMWSHTFKNGQARYPAFLEDYAGLICALIQLQEITGDSSYLTEAQQVTGLVIDHFYDEASGFFFFTGKEQRDVIIRKKEIYDGATPSGNAVMAANLYYLSVIFEQKEWKQMAVRMLETLIEPVVNYPVSFGNWACLLMQHLQAPTEVVVTGTEAKTVLRELLNLYLPGRILMANNAADSHFPLLKDKDFEGEVLIYLCRDYACKPPVVSVTALKSLLK